MYMYMHTNIQHHACVVQKSASGPTSPPPTTNRPTTTTTKQTTQKPSDDPIEQFMQNELLWCGYSGLDIQACVSRVQGNLEYYCSWAAYDCYYNSNKMSCIRDHAYLKKNQKFCSTSRYNLLVSPQTHSVAYHGYGPHIADGQDIAYCTAYCVGN